MIEFDEKKLKNLRRMTRHPHYANMDDAVHEAYTYGYLTCDGIENCRCGGVAALKSDSRSGGMFVECLLCGMNNMLNTTIIRDGPLKSWNAVMGNSTFGKQHEEKPRNH